MMIELSPLDISKIDVQPKQSEYKKSIQNLALMHGLGWAFTYTDGNVQAAVGMQQQWQGRAIVWALIGGVTNWVKLHKETKGLMESYAKKHGIIRLEMTTEVGFEESERWARMLGFKQESVMKNFGHDGKDHKMWVRLWQQQYHS